MFGGQMATSQENPDETINALRKLPSNKRCPNCQNEAEMFGFKNVCSKFGTFVCDGCKSAHQGISHRCKTIGQASFTAEDIALLRRGNDYAEKTYLGRLTRAQVCAMAPKGNPPAVEWQGWIMKVYERKEFYVDVPDYTPIPLPGEGADAQAVDPNRKLTAREKAELRRKGKMSGGGRGAQASDIPASPRAAAPAAAAAAPVAAAPAAAAPAAAAPAPAQVDLMGGFGAPAAAAAAPAQPSAFGAPAAAAPAQPSAFGQAPAAAPTAFGQAPAAAPTAFGQAPAPAPTVDTASMLAGFGPAPTQAPAQTGGFGAPAAAPTGFGFMQGAPPAGQGPTPGQMQQQQQQQMQQPPQQPQQPQMPFSFMQHALAPQHTAHHAAHQPGQAHTMHQQPPPQATLPSPAMGGFGQPQQPQPQQQQQMGGFGQPQQQGSSAFSFLG